MESLMASVHSCMNSVISCKLNGSKENSMEKLSNMLPTELDSNFKVKKENLTESKLFIGMMVEEYNHNGCINNCMERLKSINLMEICTIMLYFKMESKKNV